MSAVTIPPLLHMFWMPSEPGGTEIHSDVRNCMESWEELHTTIYCKLWTESDVERHLFSCHPNLGDAYNIARFPAMRADLVRLAAIFKYGGFWTDIKTRPLRSFLA